MEMKKIVVPVMLAFAVTGCKTAEVAIKESGASQVSGADIKKHIEGKTVYGEHHLGSDFAVYFSPDGTTKLKNNKSKSNTGKWSVDMKNNTLTESWDSHGWSSVTTNIYNENGKLKLYNLSNGSWDSTFNEFYNGDIVNSKY